MGVLTIPNVIAPGAPRNATPLAENFAAIEAWAAGGVGTASLEDGGVTGVKVAAGTLDINKMTAAALATLVRFAGYAVPTGGVIGLPVASTNYDIPASGFVVTPSADCSILLFATAEGSGAAGRQILYTLLANGAPAAMGRVYADTNAECGTSLMCKMDLTKDTAYTFKLQAATTVAGNLFINLWGTRLVGLYLPR